MDGAVREKPHQMNSAVIFSGVSDHLIPKWKFKKRAILNHKLDARQALIDNQSGAKVDMADFGIAHLSPRKADFRTGGLQSNARIIATKVFQIRRIRR